MIGFVVNPAAGNGRSKKAAGNIRKILDGKSIAYDMRFTQNSGHAVKIAAEMADAGCRSVVAVGGDGTVLECAQGLYALSGDLRKKTGLGIIAAGSGNDFARMLRLPKTVEGMLEVVIRRNLVCSDMLECNGIPVLNIACMGIDSEIAATAGGIKKIFGRGAYLASVIKNIFTYKSLEAEISLDGEAFQGRFTIIALCNGRFYGGGFQIAPMADIADGMLHLVFVDPIPWYRLLVLFPKVPSGRHVGLKEVHIRTCRRLKVTYDRNYALNMDGNIVPAEGVLEVQVLPGVIELIHNFSGD